MNVRPTQSRDNSECQISDQNDSLDTLLPVPDFPAQNSSFDPIKCLALLLMVRPFNRTSPTFGGNSEKLELFEELIHTMIVISQQ